jgi:Tfp pilus assembly protein PilO
MANWTQKKLLLTIGGTSLALCLVAGGGIYYASGLIAEVELQIEDKQKAITAAEAKIATIPVLERDVIVLRENLDEYVKILPNDRELADFLRMLNQFNRQSGVQAKVLQPKTRREAKGERFTPIEYSYELTATLWQCMKFMNLIENFERFVSIVDFTITAGSETNGADTREGDVVHKVRLTLQTYAYNGKADGKEVQIPDYKDKKQALQEEIWKRMQAIRIDKYEHPGEKGRRDVLVDPRERGDLRLQGPSQAEQRTVLERNVTEITRLKEIQAKIKKQDTTLFEQYSLEKSLREGIEKLVASMDADASHVTYGPYRQRWAVEVEKPLDELRGQIAAAGKPVDVKKDPYLSEREMRQLVAEMANDCNNGQLEQAKMRFDAVVSRVNVPADDKRHQLAVDAKMWHTKATTALDFKNLDLKVQGVVVNPIGRSGVLLNGETYEEGEYVSDDLLVKLVEEEQIWFVYRGLTLVRTL